MKEAKAGIILYGVIYWLWCGFMFPIVAPLGNAIAGSDISNFALLTLFGFWILTTPILYNGLVRFFEQEELRKLQLKKLRE